MSNGEVWVEGLCKTYRVPQRKAGLGASVKSLFTPSYLMVEAVRNVSFRVAAGEAIGLIGPNGAGKTTTLKMLSGLLHPTAGRVEVAGFFPWKRQPEFLSKISMVLGNKSQMIWDIPPLDTFYVLGEIYGVPRVELKKTLDEMVDLLEMGDLLAKPVRNFSLGERMKCELVAGLLHRPQVLFLDEPTLGLDVSMQGRLRAFVAEYNRRHGATVLLTSHYMADVTALCKRVILINEGGIVYDGELEGLARRLAPFKLLRVALSNGHDGEEFQIKLPDGAEVLEKEDGRLTLRVGREDAPSITSQLLASLPVADLSVENPPLEAVIDRIYQGGEV